MQLLHPHHPTLTKLNDLPWIKEHLEENPAPPMACMPCSDLNWLISCLTLHLFPCLILHLSLWLSSFQPHLSVPHTWQASLCLESSASRSLWGWILLPTQNLAPMSLSQGDCLCVHSTSLMFPAVLLKIFIACIIIKILINYYIS